MQPPFIDFPVRIVIVYLVLLTRNGSVKVLFRVVIKKKNKDDNPQVIVKKVGERLSFTVQSGKLGNYKIIPTLDLRGK